MIQHATSDKSSCRPIRPCKWASEIAAAHREGLPLAVSLRQQGYSSKAIRAAQRCATRLRSRQAGIDDDQRRSVTLDILRRLWFQTSIRLKSDSTKDHFGEAKLLLWLDTEIGRLSRAKKAPSDEPRNFRRRVAGYLDLGGSEGECAVDAAGEALGGGIGGGEGDGGGVLLSVPLAGC